MKISKFGYSQTIQTRSCTCSVFRCGIYDEKPAANAFSKKCEQPRIKYKFAFVFAFTHVLYKREVYIHKMEQKVVKISGIEFQSAFDVNMKHFGNENALLSNVSLFISLAYDIFNNISRGSIFNLTFDSI